MVEEWNTELHPAWYKDVSPMRFLILGSFPPHPSRWAYSFYYPNRRNRFWKILAELAGLPLQSTKYDNINAVDERYAIMKKLNVGVQNLGLEVERRGKSALDTDIKIIRFHDILSIIEDHPELERILLPGFSARESTARSFVKYLKEKGIKTSEIGLIKSGLSFEMEFGGRCIECVVLNSTSPASKIKYQILLEQFRTFLGIRTPTQ